MMIKVGITGGFLEDTHTLFTPPTFPLRTVFFSLSFSKSSPSCTRKLGQVLVALCFFASGIYSFVIGFGPWCRQTVYAGCRHAIHAIDRSGH